VAAVKLDENLPDSVAGILRNAGHDVALARDQNLAGSDDPHLLAVASAEGRILVSLDRGFANVLQHPPRGKSGIVVIRLHSQTLIQIRSAATALGKLLNESSAQGKLWILDQHRLRIWPRGPADMTLDE
jgi:predicted nuclease of predicted toxin-antitoxin system